MRFILTVIAVTLLAFAVAGCADTQGGASAVQIDPSFACPSGECQGLNGVHNLGGAGSGF